MISMQTPNVIAVGADTSPLESISTEGIRASERRDFWQSRTTPLFGFLQLEMQSKETFDASFEYTSVAGLIFCRLSAHVPHRVIRTGTTVQGDGRGYLKAVLQMSGCSVLEQSGRTTLLRPGEWSIYDCAKPYKVTIPDRAGMFMLLIPAEKVITRNLELDELAGRRFSGRQGLGKLMWSLVPEVFEQIPAIRARSSHDVADMVAQMIRLALLESSDHRVPADSKDALRERVKLYIESHLRDADLSISKLAHIAHCTKRYLHMAFQPGKSSISEYILKLRLERCVEDLRNPAFARRSITDIAYSWGFNNSNHFSRCFKQVYGISPRDSRVEYAELLAHRNGRHRKAS